MSQPGDEDCDSVLSDSSTSGSSGSSAASGALSGDSSAVCPICDYNSRNVRALWQHINAVHISRKTFPDVDFLSSHARRVCCLCGFAYDKIWNLCRRSTGSGRSRCCGKMEDPHLSPWLHHPSGTSQASDVTHEVSSARAVSDEVLPVPEIDCSSTSHDVTDFTSNDGDLVLKGMRAAADLRIGTTINDEEAVFRAVMNEVVSLQVQTVAHVPKSVRPLLAEILAGELQHACFSGICFFSVSLLLPKRPFGYHLEVEDENDVLSAPCFLPD